MLVSDIPDTWPWNLQYRWFVYRAQRQRGVRLWGMYWKNVRLSLGLLILIGMTAGIFWIAAEPTMTISEWLVWGSIMTATVGFELRKIWRCTQEIW